MSRRNSSCDSWSLPLGVQTLCNIHAFTIAMSIMRVSRHQYHFLPRIAMLYFERCQSWRSTPPIPSL